MENFGFRFIHRARLNLFNLNGINRWNKAGNVNPWPVECRRCKSESETLPHVLCHCRMHMSGPIMARHDNIQNRIVAAVKRQNPGIEIRVNQTMRQSNSRVRPDIVITDHQKRKITILDVACPFENGQNAFETTRALKIAKYTPEANEMRTLGYEVVLDAIIVGALGTWDPANDTLLRSLRVTPRYLANMKRFCVMDTINYSKNIYWQHILGDKYKKPKRERYGRTLF